MTATKQYLKAMREKCLDCMGGHLSEVKLCPISTCPLYPYRVGSTQKRVKRELTQEQREKLAERLAKARAAKGKKKEV